MINTLTRLVLLVFVWAALQGTFGGMTLFLGAIFAGGVLYLTHPLFKDRESPSQGGLREGTFLLKRVVWTGILVLVFLRELVTSAVRVAWYVLQPTLRVRPGIVAYPLDVQTDREITVLANLISLTPGTLSLDVSPERDYLYVHAFSVESPEGDDVVREIKGSLEEYVSLALGPRF